MQSDILQRIAELQAAQGEIIDRQNTLINDLFRLLMQHVSTEELTEQLEELNSIEQLRDRTET